MIDSAAAAALSILDRFLRTGIFGEASYCGLTATICYVADCFGLTAGNFFLLIDMLSLIVMLCYKGPYGRGPILDDKLPMDRSWK